MANLFCLTLVFVSFSFFSFYNLLFYSFVQFGYIGLIFYFLVYFCLFCFKWQAQQQPHAWLKQWRLYGCGLLLMPRQDSKIYQYLSLNALPNICTRQTNSPMSFCVASEAKLKEN